MNIKRIISFIVISLTFVLCARVSFARQENLYAQLSRMPIVRVYIQQIADSSQEKSVNPQELFNELKEALEKRKSINFAVVNSADEADIVIEVDIKEYVWSEKDPVDNLLGSAAIALDAMRIENYARLTALFTVKDKGGSKIWKKLLRGSATKKEMPEQESYSLVIEKVVKVFIRECFAFRQTKKQRF